MTESSPAIPPLPALAQIERTSSPFHEPSMPPKLNRSFNVMLDDQLYAQLEDAAARRHSSKGAIIRGLIRIEAANQRSPYPLCADGQPCLMPHLKPKQPQP